MICIYNRVSSGLLKRDLYYTRIDMQSNFVIVVYFYLIYKCIFQKKRICIMSSHIVRIISVQYFTNYSSVVEFQKLNIIPIFVGPDSDVAQTNPPIRFLAYKLLFSSYNMSRNGDQCSLEQGSHVSYVVLQTDVQYSIQLSIEVPSSMDGRMESSGIALPQYYGGLELSNI